MAETPPDARSLFGQALEIDSPADREEFLDRACAGDPDLRRRVDELLQAHARAGSFLEPAPPVTPDVTGAAPPPAAAPHHWPAAEGAGVVVGGRYTLVEAIGEGGMGTVWRAKQTEPVKRFVALKLIKAGMDSRQVLARFEAERQALALMDHPNIAKVLDGGVHDGRPFFVMELVKGVPITDYSDARRLTPRDRLELFVPVCQAIQHAHQKGIIHRDIKPSNVLVALYDDRPVAKVIDFGIAKATGGTLTEHTIDTGFGGVVGTPQYMSPEQATFNNVDIDTRSDVYALGVLLYELLTGSPPFSKKDLEKKGLMEILRVVREEEPPRPSTKLSTADALPTLSANRGTEPKKLAGMLRNELDWIVMKALEKDRTRRYPTANALAEDVQRYLCDEAVQACPPSLGYRLSKFTRKHRVGLTLAVSVAAVLVAGIATTGWQALRATRAEEKAGIDRDAAISAGKVAARLHGEAAAALAQLRESREKELADRYVWDMQLLPLAYESGNVTEVNRILQRQVPAAGQPDRRRIEWHYWDRRVNLHRDAAEIPVAAEGSSAWATSRDGSRFARVDMVPAKKLMQVQVWDVATRQLLMSRQEAGDGNASLYHPLPLFSPDAGRIAVTMKGTGRFSFGTQLQVLVFDIAGGREVLRVGDKFPPPPGSGWAGLPDAFSPDGSVFASYSFHSRTTSGVGAKGGGYRAHVSVWDLASGKQLCDVAAAPQGNTSNQPFAPDGKRLVTFGTTPEKNRRVQFWQVADGKEAAGWEIPGGTNLIFALSPDGKQLAGVDGGGLKLWEADTGKLQAEVPFDPPLRGGERISRISYSPDGSRVAVLRNVPASEFVPSQSLFVSLFDPAAGKPIASFEASNGPVHSSRMDWTLFSTDGRQMMIPADNEIRTWDPADGQPITTIRGFERPILVCGFSPDGRRIWAIETGGHFKEWDAHPRQPAVVPWPLVGFKSVQYFAFARDGSKVVYLSHEPDDKELYVQVATNDLKPLARWPLPAMDLTGLTLPKDASQPKLSACCLATNRDGSRIAFVRGYTYTVPRDFGAPIPLTRTVWVDVVVMNAETGEVLLRQAPARLHDQGLSMSADGRTLVAVSSGEKAGESILHVYDVSPQRERQSHSIQTGFVAILEACVSPDGRRLVLTGSVTKPVRDVKAKQERRMQVIDIESGAILATHPYRDGSLGDSSEHYCRHLAWSEDGSRFAYTGVEERVTVHDGATGAIVATMDAGQAAGMPRTSFGAPIFSPDGSRVAALHNPFLESQTRVWDAATGRALLTIQNVKNRHRINGPAMWGFRALRFSADGRRLYLAQDLSSPGGRGAGMVGSPRLSITEYP